MIRVILPPPSRPPSCPFRQRTAGVLACLARLGEAVEVYPSGVPFEYQAGDLVFYAYPYRATAARPGALAVECGVGYDSPPTLGVVRVYETEAWRHYCFGKYQQPEADRRASWVLPWARDPAEWPLGRGEGGYVSYLGRWTRDKGAGTVLELAQRLPAVTFKVATNAAMYGSTDCPSNVEFVGPVLGADRATFLGGAFAHLCPSTYVEPLCGSAVEAMLCGTPVVTTNYGGFVETVKHGMTGRLCASVDEMESTLLEAFNARDKVNARPFTRSFTLDKFSISALVPRWEKALRQMRVLAAEGIA